MHLSLKIIKGHLKTTPVLNVAMNVAEVMLAKMVSVCLHVTNVHSCFDNTLYDAYEHEDDLEDRPWL